MTAHGIFNTNIFENVNKMLKKYILEKAWFSDEGHYIVTNSNISVMIRRDRTLSGFVTGENEKEVQEIGVLINEFFR